MEMKDLCLGLANADSEIEIIDILKRNGYWEDGEAWEFFGKEENNFATIGNQKSKPEDALVEKIINSVDAVLMAECLRKGIEPDTLEAPQNITEALIKFYSIYNGKLSNITATERGVLAENIALVATGSKGDPCYSIIDKGEGQSPNKLPGTILSIGKSNKLRIPFVQGKFNMGGTAVLRFCGQNNLQLIISKRDPSIANSDEDDSANKWGFTIVRRENPPQGVRSSTYKYLAPRGKILSFEADELPLLPGDYPTACERGLKWGTFIKLYDYQMTGLKTNILFDLNYRLALLMPNIALPVRLYERREGYKGHTLETTLSGLSVRLDEDKKENLELGFEDPPTSTLTVLGQKITVSMYVFKRSKAEKYSKGEGIIFTINGQTHGTLSKSFFTRAAVKLGYIAKSLLVFVDCSKLDGRAREDLFLNSRDRLASGELRTQIERNLEELLRNHAGLKELREKRRKQDIEDKLEDSKPLAEVIEKILRKSPTLSKLFVQGIRLPNPFKLTESDSQEKYKGKRFPTFFKISKGFNKENPKQCPINVRLRIQYKTDTVNAYFDRDSEPGQFVLKINGEEAENKAINLWNGTATLNSLFPVSAQVGDILHFESTAMDSSRIEPFKDDFYVQVTKAQVKKPGKPGERKQPSSRKEGKDSEHQGYLDLPTVIPVFRDDPNWNNHEFNEETALKVLDTGENGYDFFVNMDNIHLLTEQKANSTIESNLLNARYKFGMVLIGIALLNDKESSDESKEEQGGDIFEKVVYVTKALSPILLPMISNLGDLDIEEVHVALEEELN